MSTEDKGSSSAMEVTTDDEKVASTKSTGPTLKLADIVGNILYITKGVELNHPRFLQRAIRQNLAIRKQINSTQLQQLLQKYLPSDSKSFSLLQSYVNKLPATTNTNDSDAISESNASNKATKDTTEEESAMDLDVPNSTAVLTVLPEVELYLYFLVITTLLRYDQHEHVLSLCDFLLRDFFVVHQHRRSLDWIGAKIYFYYSLAAEKVHRLESIRVTLLHHYRITCITHNEIGQATLINLILRNYLTYHLIDQASLFMTRITAFPEEISNNQYIRYLYYQGYILAIQLEYSNAYQCLMLAIRKTPNENHTIAFLKTVTKLLIIVTLLMGDIPEKSLFFLQLSTLNPPDSEAVPAPPTTSTGPTAAPAAVTGTEPSTTKSQHAKASIYNTAFLHALQPYYHITQAVRNGDILLFQQVMAQYAHVFQSDQLYQLMTRLEHNVMKIGLRKISLSYSRVSLQDIAKKLHLPSSSAAEYICAKAIRDGVIEAKIDHEHGWLSSHEVLDLYSTEEPQRAFHKRIAFCLDVHNEAVKSMRYPPDDFFKKKNKDANNKNNEGDKNEEKSIEELIKEMEDDYDE